nr:putative disease resistance RPP13-like protein 3 [Ipomoea trifida]
MAAFGAVTILMDTLHRQFLQPTPLFPLRNKTKVSSLQRNLSSLRTSLEQGFGFWVRECDEAMNGLEAQLRDVSVELRFQIEHELRLFYLGRSMKLRLHSAQKLLPILNGAIKGDKETMDFNCVMEMLGKHFTLPVSGMPRHIYKRATQRIRQLFIQGIRLTSYIKKEMLKVENAYHQSNNSQNNNPASLRGLELDNITDFKTGGGACTFQVFKGIADWEMYVAQGLLAADEDVKSQLAIG